jgi:hypothetical protein
MCLRHGTIHPDQFYAQILKGFGSDFFRTGQGHGVNMSVVVDAKG